MHDSWWWSVGELVLPRLCADGGPGCELMLWRFWAGCWFCKVAEVVCRGSVNAVFSIICTVCEESVCCCCLQDVTRLYASCRTIECKLFAVSLLAFFKGTVAWDFLLSVFFMNQHLIGPWWSLRNSFIIFREFVEIFQYEVWLSAYYLRKVKLLISVTPCFLFFSFKSRVVLVTHGWLLV